MENMGDFFGSCALIILIVSFILGIIFSARPYKRKRFLTFSKCLPAGIFFSALVFIFSIYYFGNSNADANDSFCNNQFWSSLLVALQHTMRLFAFDDNYFELINKVSAWSAETVDFYRIYGGILYVIAPLTTITFIFTFLKNINAHVRYLLCAFWREKHIFSALNEKSLALANSLILKQRFSFKSKLKTICFCWLIPFINWFKKPIIIFTGVVDKNEESYLELIEGAKELGAILFRKDISTIYFYRRKQYFYLIENDETEMIHHMSSIIKDYKDRSSSRLYVFSDSVECKYFLDSYTKEEKKDIKLEVVRINEIRSLIYHNLKMNGLRLFEHANQLENGEREIYAVIVGLGKYGMEKLKALLWYCQFPGYRVKIKAYDERSDAKERFEAMCPGLQVGAENDMEEDSKYYIDIQTIKVTSKEFSEEIKNLLLSNSKPSYVFICLGKDGLNISTAINVRCLLERKQCFADIETVIYDTALKERFSVKWSEGDKNCYSKAEFLDKGDGYYYNIHTIGDLKSFYSVGTVIESELIDLGLEVHCRWEHLVATEKEFYMNDYNFHSSIAKALHACLRAQIVEKLKDEAYIKKVFPRLLLNKNKKGKPEKDKAYWYRYVLEKTKDEASAKLLNGQLDTYSKLLSKGNKDIYPFAPNASLLCNDADFFEILTQLDQECKKEGIDTFNNLLLVVQCAAQIDHIRWNAYMRSEGYIFENSISKGEKYLKKHMMHPNLRSVEELTFADCIKDV